MASGRMLSVSCWEPSFSSSSRGWFLEKVSNTSSSLAFNAAEMKLFLDGPERIGNPAGEVCARSRMSSKLWEGFLAKPMPGSQMMFQRRMPAASAFSICLPSAPRTSATTSAYVVFSSDCIVPGSPRMCISTYGTFSPATVSSIRPSSVPPDTSLTTSAPAPTASAATAERNVSTEIGIRSKAGSFLSDSMTGRIRDSSSSAVTISAPGRVLCPPRSRMSAPLAISSLAWATAASRP
mmetsp:Transcript_4900/g.11728  ORF Transcript_4900/g.11728 Transcript_4900/m.11728 type:complete len:237 (+) Transcript_4900:251-961(+)